MHFIIYIIYIHMNAGAYISEYYITLIVTYTAT